MDPSPPPPPRLALRLRVAMAVLTVLFCLVILEGGIRLDDWRLASAPRTPPERVPILRENPFGTGSYRVKPNLDVERPVGLMKVRIRTNSLGMHWRETPVKGDGRARVAFLGDSFTFGCWASEVSKSFVGVFESKLASKQVEALNFGVGGYGLADEELILKELALQFEPSYVVVVSYNGNDFSDTWLGVHSQKIVGGGALRDEEVTKALVPAENLVPDNSSGVVCPPPSWLRAGRYSHALRRVFDLLDYETRCVSFRPNRNFLMPGFWSLLPQPEIAQKAARAVQDALGRIEELSASNHARLAVVSMPTFAQVYTEETKGRRFDTSLPQSALQTFCAERRIPYLDLLPLLRAQKDASFRRIYLNGDIHLNDFGHEKVGEMIADWFEKSVLR